MFEKFYPDSYVESAYVIDYEGLYKKGYRGIIFDIDNTLVPHGAPADERSIALFRRLKAIGYECLLLSNNKEPRVKMFNDAVHVHYIFKAGKPGVKITKKPWISWVRMMSIPFLSATSCSPMSGEPEMPGCTAFW